MHNDITGKDKRNKNGELGVNSALTCGQWIQWFPG